MYLDSLELADDGLVLGVVAGEVAENASRAGDSGHVAGAQEHYQLPQEVIQMVLRGTQGQDRKLYIHR